MERAEVRIFWTEPMAEVVTYLVGRVRLGFIDPAFRDAQHLTPSGDGYIGVAIAQHRPTGSQLIFSRDVGHHTSGWFKNPDYERCEHLSLCFRDPETGAFRGQLDWRITRAWLARVFGDAQRFLWTESAKTPEGQADGVWHFRVFCDPAWAPLLPRGEVYSRELTEKGWRSFSDVRELRLIDERERRERR